MSVFKAPNSFIKFKEPVFEGYENFSFSEVNYEITERDIKFLDKYFNTNSNQEINNGRNGAHS